MRIDQGLKWRTAAAGLLALGLASLPLQPGRAERRPPPTQRLVAAPPAGEEKRSVKYRMSDCHLHMVDFLQQTDGIRAILNAMDRCGVDHAMICGMPLIKKWSEGEPVKPGYYLDDDARCYWYSATDVAVAREVLSLRAKERERFHPFICGFNGTDRNAVDHVRRMIEWFPDFWQGIGEVMGRHDDLTALTYGETAQPNGVALDPVYDLAAELDLPVSIHSNISSVWKREPLYLPQMEEAIRKHPNTRFIWCHAGISRRVVVPTLPGEIRRLLATYPNVWIDLSWVVFENYLAPNNTASADWVDLIEAFPSRFMIGSDKVGRFDNYEDETLKYNVLLDALKPETARRVARENFLSVLPRRAATLKKAAAGRGRPDGTLPALLVPVPGEDEGVRR
jgi:predicted TIM-barrel fold metal-dependent hydrolase